MRNQWELWMEGNQLGKEKEQGSLVENRSKE